MAHYEAGEHVTFTTQRPCVLAGRQFRTDDSVRVELARDWRDSEGQREGGPWGYGGYTAQTLRSIAASIYDLQAGRVIYDAPGPLSENDRALDEMEHLDDVTASGY